VPHRQDTQLESRISSAHSRPTLRYVCELSIKLFNKIKNNYALKSSSTVINQRRPTSQ
jgi:hypothetical protein